MNTTSVIEAKDRCGCPDEQKSGLTRRGMIKLAGAAGLAVATTASQARIVYGAPSETDNILVVLSLRGGMDGLNVVPPIGDPNYARLRPSIHIPEAPSLRLDSMFGLHPAMAPLMPLWNSQKLAIVHAAGLPQPDRSHFDAMAKMEEAAPGSSERTGWIDRMIGLRHPQISLREPMLGNQDYRIHYMDQPRL